MDLINPSKIQSISACDLNTKFNDRCHAEWSKSNLIAFVTLDGIYILKPQLDIPHGPFQINLVRNPTDRFRHQITTKYFPRFDDIWQNLSHAQYMEVFLDPALATNVEKLSLEVYPRRFRMFKWSPVIDVYPKHCLMATITIDYQLSIYCNTDRTWNVIADLSSDYDAAWSMTDLTARDLISDEYDFAKSRKILHALSFCYTCWKDFGPGCPYLLASTITGDVVIWKLDISARHGSQERFVISSIIRTEIEYITSMQLLNHSLIISARDGRVVLFDLSRIFSGFLGVDRNQQVKNNVCKIDIETPPPAVTLWHRDDIEVPDFYIQPLTQNLFRIVLSKSTNICWATIGYEKKAGDTNSTLTISDSYSAIDGLDPDVSLHQTPAIWLKPAGPHRAVMVADDGSFFQLEFADEHRQDSIPDFDAIRTGKIDLTRMVPRGYCASPNGHLISMISTITLQYESAKILAPTKLILLPTLDDWKFLADRMEKLLDDDWLRDENVVSPMDVCDRIDYILSVYQLLSY